MNSKDLWENLESKSNEEIQVEISASIIYLVKKRNLKLRKIIKNIKKVYKLVQNVIFE